MASLAAAGILGVPSVAGSAATGGDGPGGTVTVGAGTGTSSGGSPGGGIAPQPGGGGAASPWICTYTPLVLNDGPGFAPGGPTPGGWYSVTCTDQLTGVSQTTTEWIPDASSATAPPVDPRSVALQAENSLQLPAPTAHFNPPGPAVVNLPTWLWVNGTMWHPYSVTAQVGPVSATAVATPISVTWSMGDGGTVACPGPGVPFDAGQTPPATPAPCIYTYATSSAGQPADAVSPEGNAFDVVATIHWSVSWTAQGAAGGGALPGLTTASTTALPVEQVESVNSSPGGSPGGSSGGAEAPGPPGDGP
jgi:hypothetical protein